MEKSFSKHANRRTINVDDVKLLARKNSRGLLDSLEIFCEDRQLNASAGRRRIRTGTNKNTVHDKPPLPNMDDMGLTQQRDYLLHGVESSSDDEDLFESTGKYGSYSNNSSLINSRDKIDLKKGTIEDNSDAGSSHLKDESRAICRKKDFRKSFPASSGENRNDEQTCDQNKDRTRRDNIQLNRKAENPVFNSSNEENGITSRSSNDDGNSSSDISLEFLRKPIKKKNRDKQSLIDTEKNGKRLLSTFSSSSSPSSSNSNSPVSFKFIAKKKIKKGEVSPLETSKTNFHHISNKKKQSLVSMSQGQPLIDTNSPERVIDLSADV